MFTVLGGGAGDFRILQRDVGSVLDEVGGRHRVIRPAPIARIPTAATGEERARTPRIDLKRIAALRSLVRLKTTSKLYGMDPLTDFGECPARSRRRAETESHADHHNHKGEGTELQNRRISVWVNCVRQTHHVFQKVRKRQTDPHDCNCNGCAASPDHSGSGTGKEKHSYDHDWTDLSRNAKLSTRAIPAPTISPIPARVETLLCDRALSRLRFSLPSQKFMPVP